MNGSRRDQVREMGESFPQKRAKKCFHPQKQRSCVLKGGERGLAIPNLLWSKIGKRGG
jgi:hypothetical protein